MKKRWSPLKAALMTCLLLFVLAIVTAAVYAGIGNIDLETSGEMFGQPLLPVLVVAGIVAYAVQKSRLTEKK
jgi:hypothetical protein